ncbi:uncharacterized protein EV422DRAFT_590168 [Fimicolochytrium jonesii]|uniref:uncharacterized protein n=1 Tax=Fimicolochytrium jonesii TaxID=1396493 RepID=UPI0022FE060C|nr:uncharacterized protein EV422DRAFT_590168 [Fimicolochytrium jonesii]KAI8817774.1 hypothetical protein EV422DRAFT_590168 [Fimicolochytrium jonesii]
MDFTELYKQTSNLCRFSPDGRYLATAVQFRVVIRDAETLQILHLFTCTDSVQLVEWSPDSQLVCCASLKLGVVQVWSLLDEEWTAKISEGVAGCTNVVWTPDSRHLLSFSEFQLRTTVWSLTTKDACYMQYPKYSDKGFCFRRDGKYLALLERVDCKDYVGIYACDEWSSVKRFALPTNDAENIAWSPDGQYIAAWESMLEYKVYIHHPDGRLAGTYSAYDSGLGIKTVQWSPSGQFLAVGSYDQKVRLLNYYTWKPILEYTYPKEISDPETTIFRERNSDAEDGAGGGPWPQPPTTESGGQQPKIQYEIVPTPFAIQHVVRPDPDKPNPKLGIGMLEFNPTGQFVAVRNDTHPTTLHIHALHPPTSHRLILHHTHPIKRIQWNPQHPTRLAICTASLAVYMCDVDVGMRNATCEAVVVPAANFQTHHLTWNPSGTSLALLDKDKFCLAFLVQEDEEGGEGGDTRTYGDDARGFERGYEDDGEDGRGTGR